MQNSVFHTDYVKLLEREGSALEAGNTKLGTPHVLALGYTLSQHIHFMVVLRILLWGWGDGSVVKGLAMEELGNPWKRRKSLTGTVW